MREASVCLDVVCLQLTAHRQRENKGRQKERIRHGNRKTGKTNNYTFIWGERGGRQTERDRERDKDRETERDRERETEKETHRETERLRQRQKQKE